MATLRQRALELFERYVPKKNRLTGDKAAAVIVAGRLAYLASTDAGSGPRALQELLAKAMLTNELNQSKTTATMNAVRAIQAAPGAITALRDFWIREQDALPASQSDRTECRVCAAYLAESEIAEGIDDEVVRADTPAYNAASDGGRGAPPPHASNLHALPALPMHASAPRGRAVLLVVV